MKSLEYCGNATVALKEKNIPEPSSTEVRIRVSFCGICGTDLHIAAGKHPRVQAGLTMGHEFSGVIDKVGRDTKFKGGERVTVEPLISCGKCYSCKAGHPHVCSRLGLYGIDKDGGFSDYVVVPADKVFILPDSISIEQGALIEPMAVGVHAVNMSDLKSLDNILVIGGGAIGFMTAIAAVHAGANVFIAEVNAFRRGVLKDLGFQLFDISDPENNTIKESVTDGKGFDIVFDCAGGSNTFNAALDLVKVRGQVVMVAVPPEERKFSYVPISFKEMSMIGVRVYEYYDFQRAINLLKSIKIDLSKIYRIFPLSEYEKAFSAAKSGDDVMRAVFSCNEDFT